jgi:nucleotide-binding universal stress UspA family protein
MDSPFTRILLATEHTEFDVGAERVAFALVKACGTRLTAVLPMVTNSEFEAVAPSVVAQSEEQAFARLTQLRAAAAAAGVGLDVRVRRGEDPAQEIVNEAQRVRADLLVARRRGKRGFLAQLLVGEMVGKVATLAPCSVLLVPRAGEMWSRRVLAAVDASSVAARVAATAVAIAQRCQLPLTVASVAARDTAGDRAAADADVAAAVAVAERAGIAVDGHVVSGRAEEAIAALAAQTSADLIVVGRSGEAARLARPTLGGTAHRIIGVAACPVLVVKP